MQQKYSVVIAEDHTILREGLKALINATDDLRVIDEAENGLGAIRCINEKKPDIVLLDLSMPKLGGISVIKEITRMSPEVKILVLTMHSDEEQIVNAFLSGAKGYCLKTSSNNELLTAIRTILSGKTYACQEISGTILNDYLANKNLSGAEPPSETLTQRELEVLKLVGEGYRNKEIADLLCISPKTVEKHRANIMNKLDLHNAAALTAYAIKHDLVVK